MSLEKEVPGEPEYASKIRRYHDQKSGDFEEKTMTEIDPFSPDFDKYLAYLRFLESEDLSDADKRVLLICKRIDNYQIASPHNIQENLIILEKQKEQARFLIEQVIESAKKYIASIYQMWSYYDTYSPDGKVLPEDKVEGVYLLDDKRKEAHNFLIESLHLANDYLKVTFGEMVIDENELQGEELSRMEAFESLDREYVAKWAYQLVKSRSEKKLPDLSKEF